MAGECILIVEDENITATSLKNILTRLGYDVLGTVASGEKALQKVGERLPDLVRQMFELYRPGKEPANKFPVDKVIGDIVTLLGSNGRDNGVSIELDTSEASVVVDMQESLLRQILYNIILLENIA